MSRIKNPSVKIGNTNVIIKTKNGKIHVDFTFNSKRIKRTTGLVNNKENLITVKQEIIPQIIEILTGEYLKTLDSQAGNNSNNITLDDMAEQHFILHKDAVRAHVYKRNLGNYYKHILHYFKGRVLKSIKAMELEAWQNRLLKKYKASTVQKYRSILFGIFTRAFQNDLVDSNPLEKVTSPKMKRKMSLSNTDAINPFTQKEIDTLVNADDDTYMPNLVKIIANTGIRIGELISSLD